MDDVEHLAERPGLNSKLGDKLSNSSLQFVGVELTSDAQYTKAELQASQLVQPSKLWYGKVNPGSRQMKLMSGSGTGCSQSEEKGILDPVVVPTGKGTMAAILDSSLAWPTLFPFISLPARADNKREKGRPCETTLTAG